MINNNTQFTFFDTARLFTWHRKFAFLPQRSKISNKIIWLKFGYACTQYTGFYSMTGSKLIWRTEQEHMIEIIKG